MARRRKTKRMLTPEQLQKMQAGRERAREERAKQAKQQERVEMLSDLDARLAEGRRSADRPVRIPTGRRHRHF